MAATGLQTRCGALLERLVGDVPARCRSWIGGCSASRDHSYRSIGQRESLTCPLLTPQAVATIVCVGDTRPRELMERGDELLVGEARIHDDHDAPRTLSIKPEVDDVERVVMARIDARTRRCPCAPSGERLSGIDRWTTGFHHPHIPQRLGLDSAEPLMSYD